MFYGGTELKAELKDETLSNSLKPHKEPRKEKEIKISNEVEGLATALLIDDQQFNLFAMQ